MKLTLRTTLILSFSLIIALMIGLAAFGSYKVSQIDQKMTLINEQNSVKQRHAINFRGSVHDRAIAIRDVVLFEDQASVDASIREIRRLEEFYAQSATPLDNQIAAASSAEEERTLNQIKEVERRTLPLVEEIIRLRNNGSIAEANDVLLSKAKPAFEDWLAIINQFIDYQEGRNTIETTIVRDTASSFTGVKMTATGIAAVFSAFILFILLRHVHTSLGEEPSLIASVLHKMSSGDLDFDVPIAPEKSVLDSVSKLKQQLNTTVAGLHTSAEKIGSSKTVQTSGNQDLNSLESEQAVYSEQATIAMQSLTSISNSIHDMVKENRQFACEASEGAARGVTEAQNANSALALISETVNKAVDKIKNLEKRTQQISGITNTISEISEQTNLLALNAAIEAARAGESGRGFAVVADEVRSLASRTGEATSEISTMLNEVYQETSQTMEIMSSSLPQLEKGMDLSNSSSQILNEIQDKSTKSQNIVADVSDATLQQLETVEELNTTMSGVIERAGLLASVSKDLNSANESTAANLEEVGIEIKSYADYFKVAHTS